MVDNCMEKLILECDQIHELPSIAEKIHQFAAGTNVWLFEGEMGAGKTTLIKAVCYHLQVEDMVSSPTFALVNEYGNLAEEAFYHFDFYRIEQEQEAIDIGVDEYFYSGRYCFVEWPSKIPSLIPDKHLKIVLNVIGLEKRLIEVTKYE